MTPASGQIGQQSQAARCSGRRRRPLGSEESSHRHQPDQLSGTSSAERRNVSTSEGCFRAPNSAPDGPQRPARRQPRTAASRSLPARRTPGVKSPHLHPTLDDQRQRWSSVHPGPACRPRTARSAPSRTTSRASTEPRWSSAAAADVSRTPPDDQIYRPIIPEQPVPVIPGDGLQRLLNPLVARGQFRPSSTQECCGRLEQPGGAGTGILYPL